MSRLVQFRDLPGGPMEIKFADEITRHCLCKSCNMLSLTMYADPALHFFCETCIHIQSFKHKKYDIYCPEERKNVSFAELYEARDVITVLCDQYVECPNQRNCTLKVPLEQLENHYIECMHLKNIKCNKCGTEVTASSWNKHKAECKPTYDTEFPSQESDSRNNRRDLPPVSSFSPPGSASRKTGSAKRATAATEGMYPADQLRRMTYGDHGQRPERTEAASLPPYLSDRPGQPSSSESEKIACPHCGRKVKEENMQRHLEKCYDFPTPCFLCNQPISRKDLNVHVEKCQQDIERRSKESKKNEAAKPIRDQPQPRSYSDVHAAYQGKSAMGMDVQYRDLPGGARTLRFADELPRRLMCGTCGMLSMQMFEDKQGHAFCIVCVFQQSQAATIFCQYENKDVALDELVESFDIVQVIKDQVVFCPNEQKGCLAYSPLSEIEDHYLRCDKTEIECAQCQQRIAGSHWKSHSRNCPRKIVQCRFCATAFPQIDIQTHQALCPENPDCITSPTVQQSYRSNASALPFSAGREHRSEYAPTAMTSSPRDPVKIRHREWPRWLLLPFVLCFTCLIFIPRTAMNVCVKPLLHIAFRTTRLVCRTVLRFYRALLSSALGPPAEDSLQSDKFRAVQQRSFY